MDILALTQEYITVFFTVMVVTVRIIKRLDYAVFLLGSANICTVGFCG